MTSLVTIPILLLSAFGAQSSKLPVITFTKHVAPILFGHCVSCHRPGEAGPFPLLTYADARSHSAQIVQVTRRRYMPPWMPEPGHLEFARSPGLTDEQISLLAAWVRGGMAEGSVAELPPAPVFTDGWQLGKPDLILRMRQPFSVPATGPDVFRNFVLPADLKETRYVRAFELRPGNKRIVHHANMVPDHSGTLRLRDGQDGQPGFSGMDVETEVSGEFDPDSHFLFWKPGSPAQQEPADMAWKLEPDTDLILNLHLRPSGKPEVADAEVGLWFTAQPPTRHPMLLQLEHDGAIDIAAGSATAAVTDHLKLPTAVSLLAIYPHAHYLGRTIDAWADLPDGTRLSLLKINRWDISWQATYDYKEPVELPAGTTVAMRIVYDNTTQNPRNPNHPPQRVHTGNRSEDEMGHVWLQVLPESRTGEDPRLLMQEALMTRRIEKYPADFVAHFNLGAALQGLGQPEKALVPLREAIRIRPASAAARNNLAAALFATNKFEDAAREFGEALAIDPGYQNARYNLARTFAAMGDHVAALRETERCLAANPEDAGAHELAGRLYSAAGNTGEALVHLKYAAERDQSNAAFQVNFGAALASAGRFGEAIAVFESALKADPSNMAAQAYLSRARKALTEKKR